MLLCLAPMDGITDSPYRIIVKEIFDKYNKEHELKMFTEFMSADGYVHAPRGVCRHIIRTEAESPLVAQIFGGNEENLLYTAKDIDSKYKFEGIELNIGCPSPKVMACGGGSGMLKDKCNTLDIIKSLSDSIKTPFSIKTRAGLDIEDKESQFEFITGAADYCSLLTIHGRTFRQSHAGEVDWNFIYRAKEKIGDKCKIVGNGGIRSYEDCFDKLGNLDGIMIGQAAIGNPWILTSHIPQKEEVLEVALRHLDLCIGFELFSKKIIYGSHEGDQKNLFINMPTLQIIENEYKNYDNLDNETKDGVRSAVEFRKHLFSYLKGLPGSKEFKQELVNIREYKELRQSIINYFDKIKTIE